MEGVFFGKKKKKNKRNLFLMDIMREITQKGNHA